ncbi:MAG: hypothetical protein JW889_12985 [Verrucomicrobia bacterium]|nr:hypothetical protein [Verrucomicrobiota bacterium]
MVPPESAQQKRQCPQCKECIAKHARKCPHCQTDQWPVGRTAVLPTVFVLLFTVSVGFLAAGCCNSVSEKTPEQAKKWQEEETKQPEREQLIDQLVARGVFREVEFRTQGATVWVDSAFYLLDFQEKSTFCSVVYAYIATQARDQYVTVRLKDITSGKTVGEHSTFGLKMR